jgi:penicillin-binding protein 2
MPELAINPGIEVRNSQLELHQFRARLAIAAGFVVLMFCLLFARFVYLQVDAPALRYPR